MSDQGKNMDKERTQFIEDHVVPFVHKMFSKHERLKSAMLLVAQFWDDEANDAVHYDVVFSELDEPDMKAAFEANDALYNDESDGEDHVNLSGAPQDDFDDSWIEAWDDNYAAIPLFACYCKEGSDQQMSLSEAYLPCILLKRDGERVSYQMVGEKVRPWLDGCTPEWAGEA